MIYFVFFSVKNTAVCLWKKKDLFFSHLKKFVLGGCFGPLFHHYDLRCFLSLCQKHCSLFVKKKEDLQMPFFYHNDLHCFLFCKKHCSLFVKKKRSFFFSHLKKFVLGGCFGCLFFTTMIYVVFCHFAKNTAVCLWNKKEDQRMLLKSELLKNLGSEKNAGSCFWHIRFFFDQVDFKDNGTTSVLKF